MQPISTMTHQAFIALYTHLQHFLSASTIETLKTSFPAELNKNLSVEAELFERATQLALGNISTKANSSVSLTPVFNDIYPEKNKLNMQYYAIKPLSPQSIFPLKQQEKFNKLEWENSFIQAVKKIPNSHQQNIPLWLDHFETCLQCYLSLIPSSYDNSISFYDFAKVQAAFYSILMESSKLELEKPFLLIQGDFFGIQDFIFSGGKDTNKKAAKLLRGRSFQVSLFTELAALKVLEICGLSTCHQMLNAAGKFLIIAPNTQEIQDKLIAIQKELNDWFVKHTYGLAGLGIAVKAATAEQFIDQQQFTQLQKSLFEQLEKTKLQRLNLTQETESVQHYADYSNGVCELNNYFPAAKNNLSLISADQIEIGNLLAKKDRMIICDYDSQIYQDKRTSILQMNIFGYAVCFTDEMNSSGDFSYLAKSYKIHRFWDFSLANSCQQEIWNGYARRYINAYIPYITEQNISLLDNAGKYRNIDDENSYFELEKVIKYSDLIKTFDYIACEDRELISGKDKYQGQIGLMTLKGDIDNLGTIFQSGLKQRNFAKMASLSRQMNLFFSLWLPAYCAEHFPNTYTVFAGGDDFFLIGPWLSTQKLATEMQGAFKRYVADNPEIHFSVGMVMTKVGCPVPTLGEMAEDALEKAKELEGKNAVTIYQIPVKWSVWENLTENIADNLQYLSTQYPMSSSYIYSLIYFAYQAENKENNIENTMWRSCFYYRTTRYIIDKLSKEKKEIALDEIIRLLGTEGIEQYKAAFSIPVFNYFYQKRY